MKKMSNDYFFNLKYIGVTYHSIRNRKLRGMVRNSARVARVSFKKYTYSNVRKEGCFCFDANSCWVNL